MDEKILELMLAKLEEKKGLLTDALMRGNCKDFAEYQYVVGQARGLAAAQLVASDLLRSIKESSDED
jgi:hypothetical protein